MEQSSSADVHLARHAVGVLVMLIVFLVITLVLTFLRIYVRRTVSRRFFASDRVFLVAEFCYIVYTAVCITSLLRGGVGYHIQNLTKNQLQFSLKLLLVVTLAYALCMALLKISICLLYIYIFPHRWVKICSYSIMMLSICWAIFTILISLLICRPLSAAWELKSGKCGNENSGYSSVAGVELIIDVSLIITPLPAIWQLQMSTLQKIATSCLFGLGLITIIVTGVRLNATLNLNFDDFSYSVIKVYYVTLAELGVAVMTTAGMCLGPVVEKLFFPRRWQSRFSLGKSRGNTHRQYATRAKSIPSDDQLAIRTSIDANLMRSLAKDASVQSIKGMKGDSEVLSGQGIMTTTELSQKSERV